MSIEAFEKILEGYTFEEVRTFLKTDTTPAVTAGFVEAAFPGLTPPGVAFVVDVYTRLPQSFWERLLTSGQTYETVVAAAERSARKYKEFIQAKRAVRHFLGIPISESFTEIALAPILGFALGAGIGSLAISVGHYVGTAVSGFSSTLLQLATTAGVAYGGEALAAEALRDTSPRFQEVTRYAGYLGGLVGAAIATDALYTSGIKDLFSRAYQAAGAVPRVGPAASSALEVGARLWRGDSLLGIPVMPGTWFVGF